MSTNIAANPMGRVMSIPDFRLLFAGNTTSLLGDQFALIATPWLALQLTGDPLVLGTVLALEGLPRAVFMLLGGAITDRLSPRRILLISDIIRMILTALMTVVIFTGVLEIWMMYAFSLGFGLVAGFAVPAGNSIVPMLVKEEDLQAGNSLIMGVAQLVGFVGPTVAGALIGKYSDSPLGIGLAFGIDAFTFAVSALCLFLMRSGTGRSAPAGDEKESIWTSILVGMKYLWSNNALRTMFVIVMAMNLFFTGPLLVGIPVLADQYLREGAMAFGLLMSAYAGGNLVGYILAGALPRPGQKTMSVLVIALLAAFGLVIGAFGLIRSTWVLFGLNILLGLGNGYIAILMFTSMQTRTPREMLGRMMSMLMLSSIGLVPISQAIAGAISKWSLSGLFIGAGGLVLLVTVWAAVQPGLKEFSQGLSAPGTDTSGAS